MEVGRGRDPVIAFKEEWSLQKDASNCVVRPRIPRHTAIPLDPPSHFVESRGTVLVTECLPRRGRRQEGVVTKEPSSRDEIVRMMQLEQERLTDGETPELP